MKQIYVIHAQIFDIYSTEVGGATPIMFSRYYRMKDGFNIYNVSGGESSSADKSFIFLLNCETTNTLTRCFLIYVATSFAALKDSGKPFKTIFRGLRIFGVKRYVIISLMKLRYHNRQSKTQV